MAFQQIFITLAVFLLLLSRSFSEFTVYAPKDLNCKISGIQCVDNTVFAVCLNFGPFTILTSRVECPAGYSCKDNSAKPCVSDTETTTDASSIVTVTNPGIVTVTDPGTVTEAVSVSVKATTITSSPETAPAHDLTTKAFVVRPTGPPSCTAAGTWPAPACNQYYECVKKTGWFGYVYYEPQLLTCSDGNYYDTGLKACIQAELSDCR